ncbi:MAG TPA: DUF1015 domain-containing protein, partial [Actinomycetota bacterium]|nr:DUF1015 domain-containing protein [Actinomycetota bacterium]
MPTLRAFHGIRYADATALKDLTCPPYDVISPARQDELYARDDHNAVRLELPRGGDDRYAVAGETFTEWRRDDILVRDERASLYVYRQDFVDDTGARRRVTGVIGALELEEFGTSSGVLPHEKTMPGPKKDRLALMTALPVNVSPIFAIYRGKGALTSFFEALEDRDPDARFADDSGILHRLWVVSAPAEVELLSGAVTPGPLVIADGHHRYETALEFARQDERPGTRSIMCFCVDADPEELVVLPYNRAVRGDAVDVGSTLVERFGGAEVPDPVAAAQKLPTGGTHPFVAVLPDRSLRAEIDDVRVVARTGPRHEAWLALDVVALHEGVLPELFPAGIEDVRFSKEPDEIVRLVRDEGFTAG